MQLLGGKLLIANCRECGALFNQVSRDICPNCVKAEQGRFESVRTFLKQNRQATMVDVVRETQVLLEEITSWIEEGKLRLIEFANLSIECRGCGLPTQEGVYCETCKQDMIMELAEATQHVRKLREQQEQPKVKFHTREDADSVLS